MPGLSRTYDNKFGAQAGGLSKHTNHKHECWCGREIRGNAYYMHVTACPVARNRKRPAEEGEGGQ